MRPLGLLARTSVRIASIALQAAGLAFLLALACAALVDPKAADPAAPCDLPGCKCAPYRQGDARMKLKYGPKIGDHAVRGDAPVHFKGHSIVEGIDHFHLDVPPHSQAHATKLLKAYVVMAPKGQGPADDETPEDFLAKGHPGGNVDVGQVHEGAELAVPVPHLPPGDYEGHTILAYEDDATPDPATTGDAAPAAGDDQPSAAPATSAATS